MAKSEITGRRGWLRAVAWTSIVAVIAIGGTRVKLRCEPRSPPPAEFTRSARLDRLSRSFSRPDELILLVDGENPARWTRRHAP